MLIGHYMHDIWAPGGVASYIGRLSQVQRDRGDALVFFDSTSSVSPNVIQVSDGNDLVQSAQRLHVDILHLHLVPPGGFTKQFPAVRSVHGHQPYCPSGSQFLARRVTPCERKQGIVPCTVGHVLDRCGSIRPLNFVDNFRRTKNEHRSPGTMLFLANSRFVKDRLLREGYDSERVRVLLYPAPPTPGASTIPVTQRDDGARFLFMGRLAPSKGVAWLLDALARTPESVSLDIAGTGPEDGELRRIVADLGLDDRVRFHGWLPDHGVAALCAGARAIVVPSLWHEPAGLVAIEAATYGRAVVVSRVGGLPEMIDEGATGIVVTPRDTGELARAMEKLAADPDLAAALGEKGRKRAAEVFTLEAHLAGLDAAYREAMLVG